jgi:hypothetical protein
MIEPFVLKGREALAAEPDANSTEQYDPVRQIWIDCKSGRPLVEVLSERTQASKFGETALTESGEGVDCAEVAQMLASQFGETIMTKSHEGVDQAGEASMASQFGETLITATSEGVDASEGTSGAYAPHSFI